MKFQSYEDSLKILKSSIKPWDRVEKVAITQALNRVLAVDIVAKDNYPSNEISAMDGYACKFKNLKEGATLKLLGDVPAGIFKDTVIKDNECLKTFTGSLMCGGADTLIPIENVEVSNNLVKIIKPVKKGFAVREIGESYKKGDLLIKKGTILRYSEIALLAELGLFHISVFIKPKVAILATGSEIKDLGEVLENEAQIHSSNHIAVASMVRLMGCEAQILPIARDKKEIVEDAILKALKGCDILITTGGVSLGDYDFVKGALKENSEILINGAAIKPGRHIKIAKFDDRYIFALPGFPYSAMVMCVLYVRVFLNEILGLNQNYYFNAILEEDYEKKSPFLEFAACNVNFNKNGQICVNLKDKKQGSSAIVNNLNQNAALLVVPLDKKGYKKGDIVTVLKMV